MNKSITYDIPKIDVDHNKVIVDVYKDSTFIYNKFLPPGEQKFTIKNCECFSRYFIEVTPINFESYYDVMFVSENILFIDKEFTANCSINTCEFNGNVFAFNSDQPRNNKNITLNSFKSNDYISLPIHYNDGALLNNIQAAVKNLHVDFLNDNHTIIESKDYKATNNFCFAKQNQTRNYKANCTLELSNSEKICIQFNIKYPELSIFHLSHKFRLSHESPKSDVIDFSFSYNRNPSYIVYKIYSDKNRTKLLASETHNNIHFLTVDVIKGSHMFFTFEMYDNLGLVNSENYKKDFDFTGNLETLN